MHVSAWLDDQPHDPARSQAQIDGLLQWLGTPPRQVLELGCGGGRVLVPLAAKGHQIIGIDRDAAALARCRTALAASHAHAELRQADFAAMDWPADMFDAVLCVGNTFMTIADVDAAVAIMQRIRAALRPGGALILDDIPHDLWPELTEGNWLSGLSEDGQLQMVWSPSDAVFTVRRGKAVDPDCWEFKAQDQRYRLWCEGALRLAARLAGLSAPAQIPQSGLLVLTRPA